MDISDADLIAKLTITEDPFTERKSNSDRAGWLRTVVAFANSTPIDQPAVLFVGVDNAGAICPGNGRIEDLMKSFSDYIAKHIYPPVYTFPRELQHGGVSCLAVIVPGSINGPHFAGRAWIRDGTQTRGASDEQFARLIAQRQSKASEILKYRNRTVSGWTYITAVDGQRFHSGADDFTVLECNAHFVTICNDIRTTSVPLNWIELSFDHGNNRLALCVVDSTILNR